MKRYKDNTGATSRNIRFNTQSNTQGSVTAINTSGIYCGLCGSKMYRDREGAYRCPSCDEYPGFPMSIMVDKI